MKTKHVQTFHTVFKCRALFPPCGASTLHISSTRTLETGNQSLEQLRNVTKFEKKCIKTTQQNAAASPLGARSPRPRPHAAVHVPTPTGTTYRAGSGSVTDVRLT
ncbi:hypothetical protein E2C01_039170 [Portunus trituberculatus]|uniref:Uncharacterized protein n=1 Tax=Portunus trituberculatus TaxID=210409 RepID=A0A5B7FE31_PORTR|nr:hypothetical protein [Portunus trituberculatus]